MRLYFWLFRTNFFISAFTFGGGYVVIPMIRKYYVTQKKLFSEEELLDMAAIAQSSPGAIAINLSALAGYRTGGLAGAAVSCLAAVVPPFIILSIISLGYEAFRDNAVVSSVLKGMEAGVAALIVDLLLDMCRMVLKERNPLFDLILFGSFAAGFLLHINIFLILLTCCLLCCLQVAWRKYRK